MKVKELRYRVFERVQQAINKNTPLNSGKKRNAYWYNKKLNFGDLLTPFYFEKMGFIPVHSEYAPAYSGVGSILHKLNTSFDGVVLGSGLIDSNPVEIPNARFSFVRGESTKAVMGLPGDLPTGDLGIAVSHFVPQKNKRFKIGIVPHYVDANHPVIEAIKAQNDPSIKIIDVEASVERVASEISECELIASSSLHGVIFSDAYQIPRVWLQLSDKLIGGSFKFNDYFSSVDIECTSFTPKDAHHLIHHIDAQSVVINSDKQQQKSRQLIELTKKVLSNE